MRRTGLILAAVALLSSCQQPGNAPEAEPAAADAPAPVMPEDAPPQEEVLPPSPPTAPEKTPPA